MYNHAEAYSLMTYSSVNGDKSVTVWNSRDGVTPMFATIDGEQLSHTMGDGPDPMCRFHKPRVGDWVWVDLTPEMREERLRAMADRISAKYGEAVDKTPGAIYESLQREEFRGDEPALIQVTDEHIEQYGWAMNSVNMAVEFDGDFTPFVKVDWDGPTTLHMRSEEAMRTGRNMIEMAMFAEADSSWLAILHAFLGKETVEQISAAVTNLRRERQAQADHPGVAFVALDPDDDIANQIAAIVRNLGFDVDVLSMDDEDDDD